MFSVGLVQKVEGIDPQLRPVLLGLMTEIEQKYATEQKIDELGSAFKSEFGELKELVRDIILVQKGFRADLGELKEIVRDLSSAQKRTEHKVEELADAQKRTEHKVEELADAQKRTEHKVEELADAQKRTEHKVEELADAQKRTEQQVRELAVAQKNTEKEIGKLSRAIGNTREQLGGLSKSVAYALENEAYRNLPAYLKRCFNLDISERLIRKTLEGDEINIFAKARRNGEDVIIVGETVLRLDDRSKMRKLNKKVKLVGQHYTESIIPLIITHFARPDILKAASDKDIIVVQSFEWDQKIT